MIELLYLMIGRKRADDVRSMSFKDESGKTESIAYSLEVQKETQVLLAQVKKTVDRNNRFIKILCYALLGTCIMLAVTMIMFYQTNLLGQFVQAIAKVRLH